MAEDFEELLKQLSAPSPGARSLAALALGRLRDRRAVLPLAGALRDGREVVREAAASALGELGDADAQAALVGALEDEHPTVRYQAAQALGHAGGSGAVYPLIRALGDSTISVRHAAAEALGRLGALAGAALGPLRALEHGGSGEAGWVCAQAIRRIEAALRDAPSELESAPAPAGRGTELESAPAPPGRGTELEAGPGEVGSDE